MSSIEFISYYIVIPLLVLTILVFVHEWGHFWVARKNNVRVEIFSVGFGPEIFGYTDRYNTRWKFSAIPLGGYVKMFGETVVTESHQDTPKQLTKNERAVAFSHKTLGQKSAIVAAGPLVNFIFAIIAFAALSGVIGTKTPLSGVGNVIENSAAEQAGFRYGDKILRVNDQPLKYFTEIRDIVQKSNGTPLSFLIERNNKTLILQATPKSKKISSNNAATSYILGIEWNPNHVEYKRENPIIAIWIGIKQTTYLSINILTYVGKIFFESHGTDDLGGPLKIAKISGDMAQKGIEDLILLMAVLSVNLGLINLFPIPVLDGGHLLFYALEGILKRPLGEKFQEYSLKFGFLLLMSLFLFVSWNDIMSF